MRRVLQILLSAFLFLCVFSVRAQKEQKAVSATENKKPTSKYKPVFSYLGNTNLKGGSIPKRAFDSLIKQGIHARDEAGQNYRIETFTFTYGERNFYEDSVGTLKIMVDYLSEPCFGDTLSGYIKSNLFDRSKQGDTVYFDNIIVTRPDNTTTLSKSMKFAIGQ